MHTHTCTLAEHRTKAKTITKTTTATTSHIELNTSPKMYKVKRQMKQQAYRIASFYLGMQLQVRSCVPWQFSVSALCVLCAMLAYFARFFSFDHRSSLLFSSCSFALSIDIFCTVSLQFLSF